MVLEVYNQTVNVETIYKIPGHKKQVSIRKALNFLGQVDHINRQGTYKYHEYVMLPKWKVEQVSQADKILRNLTWERTQKALMIDRYNNQQAMKEVMGDWGLKYLIE